MALESKPKAVEDNPHFDKVFEQTTQEEAREKEAREKEARKNKENEKQEKGLGSTAHETKSDRTNDKLKARILCFEKARKPITGEVRENPTAKPAKIGQAKIDVVESDNATKAKRSELQSVETIEAKKSTKVTSQKQTVDSDQAKGVHRENISNEQKAQGALKQRQLRQAAKAKAQKEARQELKLEDKAKAAELRTRNAPTKVLVSNLQNATKTTVQAQNSTVSERETSNGTQVAVNSDKMVMQAKQSAPNEASKPALVEELRPATSAEMSSQAGNQHQDLPREEAKENTLSPAPVVAVTSAATGTAVQAFTPSAGVITPLMEKIWNAVSTFRARGGDELVVKLQPDSRTKIQLTIKYGNTGVEIQARMQQGDSQQLASGWSELQQALTDRGVSLGDLARERSAESDFEQTARNFNKNNQNQAENKDLNIGDDQEDWSTLGMKPKVENTTQTRREKALPVHDGWQSWA